MGKKRPCFQNKQNKRGWKHSLSSKVPALQNWGLNSGLSEFKTWKKTFPRQMAQGRNFSKADRPGKSPMGPEWDKRKDNSAKTGNGLSN
jgi:hypothetical protein